MTIAPIVRTVTVKAGPKRAFDLFVSNMERWWPLSHHIGKTPFTAVIMEPKVGGRWFERDASGAECQWGEVLAWEPPTRILLAWRLNARFEYDPTFLTEVELRFAPTAAGGTAVTLEHRNLERFGADAEKLAGELGGGWPSILADFAGFADVQSKQKEPTS
jgi:uncharacterized protein YndB with AHSA1/START domain